MLARCAGGQGLQGLQKVWILSVWRSKVRGQHTTLVGGQSSRPALPSTRRLDLGRPGWDCELIRERGKVMWGREDQRGSVLQMRNDF